jgi:hypothetical protein
MIEGYISRTNALKAASEWINEMYLAPVARTSLLLAKLRELPAADVAPVVHGRWMEEKRQTLLPVEYDDVGEPILHDYVVYRCDRCGRTCKQKEPYCHCGAKMEDGGNE